MEPNTLIVGGTSGLGRELAYLMAASDHYEYPIVTGRHDPEVGFAEYREFDLNKGNLPARIGQFVMDLPPIKSLVYAAGFPQMGHITELSDEEVDAMFDVGGRGLVFFVKKLLEKQDYLDELVTITSTSQWTPREFEPVYNFVKAGAAHYSHGQSLDPRIGKTLVVGPSGMDSEFWEGMDKDTSKMMSPEWVARRIMELRQKDDKYLFAKILGATAVLPRRVVEGEECGWIPENGSLAWNLLSIVSQEPDLNSGQLAVRFSADPSQISRAGSKLATEGYITKHKIGRRVFWQTNDLGLRILQAY
jgi:short-subunit dehydrogenase